MSATPAGLRLAQQYPARGVVAYQCAPIPGATNATIYTYRRNGAVIGGQNSPGAMYDAFLYPGDSHRVTVSASLAGDHSDESPESDPLRFTMPAPVSPVGGELLYLMTGFADVPYGGGLPDLMPMLDYLRAATGGRVPLSVTTMAVVLSGNLSDYAIGGSTTIDAAHIVAELTDALELRTRPGLHRVLVDLPPPHTLQDNAGIPLWGASMMDPNAVWASFVTADNATHEVLHTWGLGHCAYLLALPGDPDNPTGTGYCSSEVMGGPSLPANMNFSQRLMLGGKTLSQMVKVPAYGGTYTINAIDAMRTDGLQAVVIPCTEAGSCYVIEHRGGLPRAQLRPFKSWRSFQVAELPLAPSASSLLIDDLLRGIRVTYSGFTSSGMTVTIRTAVAPPMVPSPTPAPVPTAPRPGHGRKGR